MKASKKQINNFKKNKPMNVLKINIGLNNNPLNAEQIKQMFYKNNTFLSVFIGIKF